MFLSIKVGPKLNKMNTTVKIPWLKIIGWAFLIHVILIASSFIEVFIYATLVNSGQEQADYEAHATKSAPYIAIILGFIILFFIARFLVKKYQGQGIRIGILLALAYVILDVILLLSASVDWSAHYISFGVSFSTKILAGYLGGKTVI